jgi:glycosyltransferase involved in cell wall biosynthesis
MTLIEAMGTGLPIVTTRVGGIPDMLDDDIAILVEGSSDAICDGFEKYYRSKDLRMAHGKAVLKKVNMFSLEVMTEKYLNEYLTDNN